MQFSFYIMIDLRMICSQHVRFINKHVDLPKNYVAELTFDGSDKTGNDQIGVITIIAERFSR